MACFFTPIADVTTVDPEDYTEVFNENYANFVVERGKWAHMKMRASSSNSQVRVRFRASSPIDEVESQF